MVDPVVAKKIEAFFDAFPSQRFVSGDVLISPGDPIKEIYYLKNGAVKMVVYSEDGTEAVLHMFRAGAYFPMMMILSSHDNNYYFCAAENVEITKAPVSQVIEFTKTNPDVLFDLVTRFSMAMMGLLLRIEQDVFKDAYQKTASLFVYLASRFGEQVSGGVRISLELKHQDIAAWLGIRRETASRQIEKLQHNGLLQVDARHFIIKDIDSLRMSAL